MTGMVPLPSLTQQNLSWLNKDRAETGTDFSFQYDFASTSDLLKVTRRETQILQDWLWNFSGIRPALHRSHLKVVIIKSTTGQSRLIRCIKTYFQISACFIQGAKISKLLSNMRFPYLHFDNLSQPVWLQAILKKLMLGKVAIAPLSQLKEQNSKVSLKAFWKATI